MPTADMPRLPLKVENVSEQVKLKNALTQKNESSLFFPELLYDKYAVLVHLQGIFREF